MIEGMINTLKHILYIFYILLRSSMTTRNTLANGTTLSTANQGPSVSTTYPLGSFMEGYY